MRKTRMTFALVGLLALSALFGAGAQVWAWGPAGFEAPPPPPMATPVKAFRECQEIARCSGCRPVYKCRSCTYQRVCSRGRCEWRDVCVWGPARKVLPQGARIIRVR